LDQAKRIYRTKYWDRVNGDKLPPGLDYAVLDYGVNSGVGRSNRILRRLVDLPTNSIVINDAVIAAVLKRDPKQLINALLDEREAFLRRLRTFPTFGRGWMRRTRGVRREALQMSQAGASPGKAPTTERITKPFKTPKDGADAKGQVAIPVPGKMIIAGAAVSSGGLLTAWLDWVRTNPSLALLIVLGAIIGTVSLIYGIRRVGRYVNDQVPAGLTPVPEHRPKRVRRPPKAAVFVAEPIFKRSRERK